MLTMLNSVRRSPFSAGVLLSLVESFRFSYSLNILAVSSFVLSSSSVAVRAPRREKAVRVTVHTAAAY